MPKNVKLYPYSFSTDVQVRLLDAFDPENEEDVALQEVFEESDDDPMTAYDLSDPDLRWRKLEINLEVVLPKASFDHVFPKGGGATDDIVMIASVRCPATKVREAYELNPDGEGRWTGGIRLFRALLRDSATITPILARKTVGADDGSGSGMASERHALIAEGRGLRIYIDQSELPFKGDIDFKWEDFRTSEHEWRKNHSSDVFYLDVGRVRPLLFVNSRYGKLKAALLDSKNRGVDAVVRNLANLSIAQAIWMQLFVASVGAIEVDEESGTVNPPQEEWRRHVLRRFGSVMFPEKADDDRLRALAEQSRSPDQVGALISKAGTAVQEMMTSYKLLERAIRAGEKAAEKEARR